MALNQTTGQGSNEGDVRTPEEIEAERKRLEAEALRAVVPQAGAGGAAATATPAPAAGAQTTPGAPAPGPDPFSSIGGGVLVNGGWVPKDHPLAAQAQASTQTATGTAGAATASNPAAAPAGPTTNAGTQDTVRNSYLALATQNPVPDANDPVIRRQSEAYQANTERAVRSGIADAAEAAGPTGTGAVRGQARMLRERGGALTGQFEADLVARENTARRSEILQALQGLSGQITEDQRQALQKELAQLNASLERASMAQNQGQFADTLGFNIADREQFWNDTALRHILTGQ